MRQFLFFRRFLLSKKNETQGKALKDLFYRKWYVSYNSFFSVRITSLYKVISVNFVKYESFVNKGTDQASSISLLWAPEDYTISQPLVTVFKETFNPFAKLKFRIIILSIRFNIITWKVFFSSKRLINRNNKLNLDSIDNSQFSTTLFSKYSKEKLCTTLIINEQT